MLLPAVALCACGAYQANVDSPQSKVRTSGGEALISQLTAGTWIDMSRDAKVPLPRTARDKAVLVNAITAASGCNVTDTNDSRDGLQLDAQVECDVLRKN